MTAAVIAVVSTEVVDADVTFGMVLINAIIGYIQEAWVIVLWDIVP